MAETSAHPDFIPAVSEWSCGHHATAMCAECYRLLALRALELAEENDRLREALEDERRQREDRNGDH